jgi:acyl carrier protein
MNPALISLPQRVSSYPRRIKEWAGMAISRQEIVAHVNKTLVDEFEVAPENISPDKRLREDLELDSLDAVDMIVALEQGLKIRVDEEQAKQIRTVGDIYSFVEKMMAQPSATPALANQ